MCDNCADMCLQDKLAVPDCTRHPPRQPPKSHWARAAAQHFLQNTIANLGPRCRCPRGRNCEPTQQMFPADQSKVKAQLKDQCWNWGKQAKQPFLRTRRCTTAGTNRLVPGLRISKRCALPSNEVPHTRQCTSCIRTGPPSQTPRSSDTHPCSQEHRHRHCPCPVHHIRKRLPHSSEDQLGIRRCNPRRCLHRCRHPTPRSHKFQPPASQHHSDNGPHNLRVRPRRCRFRPHHSHKRQGLPSSRRSGIRPHSPKCRHHRCRCHSHRSRTRQAPSSKRRQHTDPRSQPRHRHLDRCPPLRNRTRQPTPS
mmetsp:Transcript_50241/g.114098  ORF Transcript_50241/g.114098 Transcript_50241/m.114098 type:complete len:308 (-) Transcript_50241:3224-4147(-)